MVNPENLRIPVWVSTGTDLRRVEHNVGVSPSVDRIAIAADIVCCVVHGKFFGRKHGVVDETN